MSEEEGGPEPEQQMSRRRQRMTLPEAAMGFKTQGIRKTQGGLSKAPHVPHSQKWIRRRVAAPCSACGGG